MEPDEIIDIINELLEHDGAERFSTVLQGRALRAIEAIKQMRRAYDDLNLEQPAPAVADGYVLDAERYRFLRHCVSNTDSEESLKLDELLERVDSLEGSAYGAAFDAGIDAAMLAASAQDRPA